MAFQYFGVANTYRTIIRNIIALVGDGTSRLVRVGNEDCPLPTGWTEGNGTPVNVPFFNALKAAARRLTGAQTDAELSGLSIPAVFFLVQGPNTSFLESLHAVPYPDGQLLDQPLFENVDISIIAGNPTTPNFTAVVFETNPDGPRYADLGFTLAAGNNNLIFVVKLFHSLTQ